MHTYNEKTKACSTKGSNPRATTTDLATPIEREWICPGQCADLASEIYSGRAKNGFALIRPPGHHARVHQSMGFCLHNNVVVAAVVVQVAGAKKVLIVDWDVHHGNGTQEIFDMNESCLAIEAILCI